MRLLIFFCHLFRAYVFRGQTVWHYSVLESYSIESYASDRLVQTSLLKITADPHVCLYMLLCFHLSVSSAFVMSYTVLPFSVCRSLLPDSM